ncbi:hypothetical protein A0O36_02862 [Piscirickettsiaceae bacterium NZ-RLO1]|nr:hypothetical protein A0O36_02862 [Piscirickettsiaceae bacterium NZ-RLO1]
MLKELTLVLSKVKLKYHELLLTSFVKGFPAKSKELGTLKYNLKKK